MENHAMKNKCHIKLQRFGWRAGFTILCLLIGGFFLPYISWGGIPSVTSVTPNTTTSYSPQDVVISGSNFEIGAKVSLLNGQLFLAGSYNTSGTAYDVYISGNYVYVADGVSGLQVIDISNPGVPSLRGSYNTPGTAYDVHVSGNYAYVADGSLGLQVIDISNPGAPVLAGSYSINLPCLEGCWASSVHVSGNYAYLTVAGPGLLQVIDISNPAAPTLIGSYSTSSGAVFDVHVSGNYAYVAVGSGLKIIDISNPALPVLTGSYNTSDGVSGVYISGNYAYVANWFSGLQIINISNPAAPVLTGSYDTSDAASNVYVSGNYAYVADRYSGLQVIDINNPAVPTIRGTFDTPDWASGVYVSGSYAYVADNGMGLHVIRINDPATNINVVDSNTITATFPAPLPNGTYHVLVTNPGGEARILYNGYTVVNATSRLQNISTRAFVGTGDNVTIGGIIISGDMSRTVLIRSRGASMGGAPFNIQGTLSNPFLKLYSFTGGAYIAQNDDWEISDSSDLCGTSGYVCGDASAIIATGMDPCVPNPDQTSEPPGCHQESAILITLPPGNYGAVVSGVNNATGIGLVEVFDTDGSTGSTLRKLTNISTRVLVGTGDEVEIGGFIRGGGTENGTVLIRARGPSMSGAPFNISGTLSNLTVKLYSFAQGAYIAQNDDWETSDPLCANSGYTCGDASAIIATGLDPCIPNPDQTSEPPGCHQESAILITLPPGNYGAIVSGVGGGTGVGLVEVFEVSQ